MNIVKVDELYHYGVPGMKWGVRHDKSLTKEQNRQRRKEIREDNKKAYELGRNATIYGRALKYSNKSTKRLENVVNKLYDMNGGEPSKLSAHFLSNWRSENETRQRIADKYRTYQALGEMHCAMMKDKYGAENVTNVKYKKVNLGGNSGKQMMVDERVSSGKDWLKSAAITGASAGLNVLGMPFAVIAFPSGPEMMGYRAYNREQMQTSRNHKK